MIKLLMHHYALSARTQTFINREIKELQANSSVEVHVLGNPGERETQYPIKNLSYYPRRSYLSKLLLKILKISTLLNSNWHPSWSRKVNGLLEREEFDLIHSHFGTMSMILWDNLQKNSKNNVPFFIHFHGYDASKRIVRDRKYRNKLKNIFQLNHVHPIFMSEYAYEFMCSKGLMPDKKRVLYYGIDTDLYKPNPVEYLKNTYKLLQVSALREKKGHIYTLRALNMFIRSNPEIKVKYFIAGDGPAKSEIMNEITRLQLNDQVVLLGWLEEEEVIEWMNRVDVFVHHSVTSIHYDQEGIPNTIIEAMAMELPVLSTYHAGIPELVSHEINGFLCKERDVECLAEQMEDIRSWSRQKINREQIKSNFDIRGHTGRLIDMYREEL